jgi:ABC-type Fe3+-hydroxamate transport system substrate-binding protein
LTALPRRPAAPRIASLVPSVTELLCVLGLGPFLVARTGFCIHPERLVAGVPKVGGTKDVDLRKLQRSAPTHVIVNVDENRAETVVAMRAWEEPPQVIVTHPTMAEDNLALIELMLAHFGSLPMVTANAATLAAELRAELQLTEATRWSRRQVLYLIWRAPWMTVARNTYISGMLARINWQTLPAVQGGPSGADRYPVIAGDEPWLASIDQVLLSSEPYRFGEAHVAAAQALCPTAQVRLVDGELLSWYGARAVPGLRYLRQLARLPA